MVERGFGLGVLRLIRSMKVDQMLALFAVAGVAEMELAALPKSKVVPV